MSKMTRSESGALGAERTKEVWQERYAANPRFCSHCETMLPYKKRNNKFCDSSCSASCNNEGVNRWSEKTKDRPFKEPKRPNCEFCNTKLLKKNAKRFCSVQCSADSDWALRKKEIIDSGELPAKSDNRVGRRFLFDMRGHRCEICGGTEWRGEPIPLIMDHIDGNSENNKLDNIRLVCGNCDMQLSTYKNRNKGNGRHARRIRYAEGKSY